VSRTNPKVEVTLREEIRLALYHVRSARRSQAEVTNDWLRGLYQAVEHRNLAALRALLRVRRAVRVPS
jgi:hypothetical protein